MKLAEAVARHKVEIRQIVEQHNAVNARIFGSLLRGEETEASDLDLLIEPTPRTTLFDIGAIKHDLQRLLGVTVDVLTPNSLPDWIRAEIMATAKPL